VDVQNDYLHEDGSLARSGRSVSPTQAVVPRIASVIDDARSQGVQVVWVKTEHHDWTNSPAWTQRLAGKQDVGRYPICVGGSWGAEFYQVSPREGEPVITKHRYSGFVNTDLDTVLRSLRIQHLVVIGVTTNVCVDSTARDAVMRDYFVTLVTDCMAADTEDEHMAALRTFDHYFGELTDSEALMSSWSERAPV
jgi:ureidoacrylate peracid hydrolase